MLIDGSDAAVESGGRNFVRSRHGDDGRNVWRWEERCRNDAPHGMTHDDDGCTFWVEREYVGYGAGGVFCFDIQRGSVECGKVFIILDLGRPKSEECRHEREGTHRRRNLEV